MNLTKKMNLVITATLPTTACAAAPEDLPAALKALEKQGVSIAGLFESKTGLKAYAATANGPHLASSGATRMERSRNAPVPRPPLCPKSSGRSEDMLT